MRRLFFHSNSITKWLLSVWGPDNINIMKLRRIQGIVKEFSEERETVTWKDSSGRPRLSCCDDNVQEVREIIEDDNGLSCADISIQTGIEERSVYRILSEHLNKKSLCCRWVLTH